MGAQPPPLQTRCSQHGFGRDSYALKQNLPAKKRERAGATPHLQTQFLQHGFGRDSNALKQACPALRALRKKRAGGLGGRSPHLLQTQCSQPGCGML